MSGLEYVRLHHHYEAALRHWGRALSSAQNPELIGVIARQAGRLRYQAQSESALLCCAYLRCAKATDAWVCARRVLFTFKSGWPGRPKTVLGSKV